MTKPTQVYCKADVLHKITGLEYMYNLMYM